MHKEIYLNKLRTLKEKGLLPSSLSGPVMVAWDITNKCNFNCLFCFNNSGIHRKESLSENEIHCIMKAIIESNPFWVCICGGEPLLAKNILKVIENLSNSNIQVSMVSNGWLISSGMGKELKRSGLKAIQISLDGCKSETHDFLRQKKGSFIKALRAIENCVKEGIHVDIAFCPTKLNYKELGAVVDIAVKLGVKGLRSQPLMILGRAFLNKNLLVLDKSEEKELLDTIRNKQEEYIGKFEITYGNPLVHFFTFPNLPCSFLHITSTGNIKISPYIPFCFGNILKHDIKMLWKERLTNAWQNKLVLKYIENIGNAYEFEKKRIITGLDEDICIEELERWQELL